MERKRPLSEGDNIETKRFRNSQSTFGQIGFAPRTTTAEGSWNGLHLYDDGLPPLHGNIHELRKCRGC